MPMCRSPPFLSKNADKKEMEEIKCQKNITFMSTDKGLKSVSRYIKSTGEKKNTTIVLIEYSGLPDTIVRVFGNRYSGK